MAFIAQRVPSAKRVGGRGAAQSMGCRIMMRASELRPRVWVRVRMQLSKDGLEIFLSLAPTLSLSLQ